MSAEFFFEIANLPAGFGFVSFVDDDVESEEDNEDADADDALIQF